MVTSPLVPGWKIAPIMSDLRVSHGDRVAAVGIAVSDDRDVDQIYQGNGSTPPFRWTVVKGERWDERWSSSNTTWETGVSLFVND